MSTVRIGYVLKMFPRYSETFVQNEVLELERRGVPLVVYSLKPAAAGPRHAMLSRLRAPVVTLPESGWRGLPAVAAAHARLFRRAPGPWLRTAGYVLSRHSWAALKRFLQCGPLVLDAERRGLTHLHAHFASSATRVAMLAARLSGLTYSFTAHAKDIYLLDQDVDLLRDKILEARFVVTVSEHNRAHLARLCGDHAGARVQRLYNGVDLAAFGDAPVGDPGRILCVARLVEKKGIADLIDACARLRARGIRFSCRIIGDGPLRAPMAQRIRDLDLGEQVCLVGALPHERVTEELAGSGLLALPCVVARDGNRDGLPTVILEAMASARPVISTRVTGIPEMVEDGVTGFVTEPGDPESLAGAIARLIEDPPLARRMGEAGRRRAEERFSLSTNVGLLHELFESRLATPATQPLATPPVPVRAGQATAP